MRSAERRRATAKRKAATENPKPATLEALKVFVYPEKTRETLGARRWQISWEELREGVIVKEGEDIDFDRDLVSLYLSFPKKEDGEKKAREILDAGRPFFGAISLTEQVVDWFVEEDRVAEWRDCGEREEIS